MNLIVGIILLLIGSIGAYFTWKNIDRIYDLVENNMKDHIGWLLRIAILVEIAVLTAGAAGTFEKVPVLGVVLPFLVFAAGGWFFIIKPTLPKKAKKI